MKIKKLLSCLFTAIIGTSMILCSLHIIVNASSNPKGVFKPAPINSYIIIPIEPEPSEFTSDSTSESCEYELEKPYSPPEPTSEEKKILENLAINIEKLEKEEASINEMFPLYYDYILSSNSLVGLSWTDPIFRF